MLWGVAADVGKGVRLGLHQLEPHVLRRRQVLHGLIDVTDEVRDLGSLLDVRRVRQKGTDDARY